MIISQWKKVFVENSAAAFEAPKADDAAIEKQQDRYLRKIGDLEMKLDFAKRVSRQLGIDIPAGDRYPRKVRSASRSSERFLG